jgi:hypothetical protein
MQNECVTPELKISDLPRGSQDMSDKPKRKFWQFHLLTLVLMIMLAGTFVTLNIPREWGLAGVGGPTERSWNSSNTTVGWPLKVVYFKYQITDLTRNLVLDSRIEIRNPFSLVWNTGICLFLLVLAFGFSEWLIRRREARKT